MSRPREPLPFTIYGTSVQESAVQYLAKSILCSVEACFTAGATFIYSVASALDHLCSLDVPLHHIGIKDFTVFMDGANTVVLSFNACDLSNSTPSPPSVNDVAVDVFSRLCLQTFNDASKLLYRDHSVHNINGPKAMEMPPGLESMPSLPTTDAEISAEDSWDDSPPRREITWENLTDNTVTLEDISRQYQDILESLTFAPFHLEPEMRTAGVYRLVHRCQGYRREEVTFKPVIFDCKVVTYVTPALHEKCLICGRDVEEGVFNCICGRPDDGVSPTVKCARCSAWIHDRCNTDICRMCMSNNVAQPPQPQSQQPFEIIMPQVDTSKDIGRVSGLTLKQLQQLKLAFATTSPEMRKYIPPARHETTLRDSE